MISFDGRYIGPTFIPPPSEWEPHIDVAERLVELNRPLTVAELGVFKGYSLSIWSSLLYRYSPGGAVFGVDHLQGDENTAAADWTAIRENLRALESEHWNIYLIEDDTVRAGERWAGREVDILHIDSCHRLPHVLAELTAWLPHMSDKGVVCMHDTMVEAETVEVRPAYDLLATLYPSWEDRRGCGLGVIGFGEHAILPAEGWE